MDPTALLSALRLAVGSDRLHVGDAIGERHLSDWLYSATGAAPLALVRPRDTAEVSAIMAACHAHRVPVVPQGGLTGLAGGAVPVPGCVCLSLELMSGIEQVDPASSTLTAWAGTPLQTVQEAAADAGLLFPLDIGSRGSCQIGGNLSTNAGGNRVLRYGMARELVLGLEVVLADGTVLSSMNKMLKNNTGYDLKQWFLGSEGTLGVITRAVLRLHPKPLSIGTAMLAVADYAAAVQLLTHVKSRFGGKLSAFELMWPDFYDIVTTRVAGSRPPLAPGAGGYVLLEASGVDPSHDAQHFETVLADALEQGLAMDAVIAQSHADAQALWQVRDGSGELRQVFWPHVGFDVSVPTGEIGAFVQSLVLRLRQRWPQVATVFFGHIVDANVHIAVRVGDDAQPESEIEELVYAEVGRWQGSISAEHGIGTAKRGYLHHSRSPAELRLMRQIKEALDPHGILNPGKVLPDSVPDAVSAPWVAPPTGS